MSSREMAVVALAAIALLACNDPVCGCSPPPPEYTTHVVGFVRDTAGAPAAATVIALFRDLQCGGPAVTAEGAAGWRADTGVAVVPTGRYAMHVVTAVRDTLCVVLVARSATRQAVRDSLRLAAFATDTVRVDFTLH